MEKAVIYDAHAHIGSDLEQKIRKDENIATIFNVDAGNPEEIAWFNKSLDEEFYASVGLHPWNAQKTSVDDVLFWLKRARIIGEIGMDSVWCEVPLSVQREVFERQLFLAASEKKPVILHTKGQEEECAALISKYPNRYLVHWYSDEEEKGLEQFLLQDCYFTVGPDVMKNKAVMQVVRKAPLNRLLLETDGWPAVCWAFGERPADGMRELLEENLSWIAREKGVDREVAERAMRENFLRFVGER